MNNKTRRLQVFMRALSAADLQGSLVRDVKNEMARIDEEMPVGSQSGLSHAVSQPEMVDD